MSTGMVSRPILSSHSVPETSPHAARRTVIPASNERTNEMGTRNRHGRISWGDPHKLANPLSQASDACPYWLMSLLA